MGFCNRCSEVVEGQNRWCGLCRIAIERETVVSVRMPKSMKSWILSECERIGISRSEYLRGLVRRAKVNVTGLIEQGLIEDEREG